MSEEAEQQRGQRQTLSYLRALFRAHGLQPKSKLGQNFLIDLNLLDVVLRAAELTRTDLAVEIGTGTGSLTGRLAEAAGGVLSVEIDPAFFHLAQETLGARDNIFLLPADVLASKNRLNPEVLERIGELSRRWHCSAVKLVANLPFAVATPVLANFLMSDVPLERLVVTVQWEIAERLRARPGTKDYGALAVLVQSLAEVEMVRRLPPAVFWPQPKVASAIVRIRPSPAKRVLIPDVLRFRHFLRDLYAHRRKKLRGALLGLSGPRRSKEEIDRLLAELDLDGSRRAETLDLAQHRRLSEVFG